MLIIDGPIFNKLVTPTYRDDSNFFSDALLGENKRFRPRERSTQEIP